jgi:hydroxymethylbilane synthase
VLEVDAFVPAVGQGAIGIEARETDTRTRDLLAKINHAETLMALQVERAFLAVLDGSCRTPIAGHARIEGGDMSFRGLILRPDGSEAHETARRGPIQHGTALAADAAHELKARASPGFFDAG